jgi:plastocyanin
MATRKHIKKQHRLAREERRRALASSQTQRRLLGFGAAAIVIAAVAGLALAFAPWSGSGEATQTVPSLSLSIGDNFFQPDEFTVRAGQKYLLKLVNDGQATHDVWMAGSDNKTSTGDDIRSKPIPGGGAATVKIKYDNPGTYYFVCTFHAGQGGTLIVEEPATAEGSPQ